MNAKHPHENIGDSPPGRVSAVCTSAAVVVLGASFVTLALTTSLLVLTLPDALDAVAVAVSAPPAVTGR